MEGRERKERVEKAYWSSEVRASGNSMSALRNVT
jgi:hypothetical protein